jgi:hypothetical protein
MHHRTCRRIGSTVVCIVTALALACGNTQAGSSYSDQGNTASVSQLQVTETAFYGSTNGAEFLIAGEVPSGELSFVHLTFFDAEGRPAQVDTNNDGTLDATSLDIPASQATTGQEFFQQIQLSESLTSNVHRVGAQVVDRDGNLSNTVYADIDGRPSLNLGDPCDPRGFNVCPDKSTCRPRPSDWQAHCIANSAK